MQGEKQKSLSDTRGQQKMLHRWENEGGATVAGEQHALADANILDNLTTPKEGPENHEKSSAAAQSKTVQ